MSVTLCDFCNSSSPEFTYPCRDFGLVIPGHATHSSRGPWFACVLCSQAIEACDHAELLRRSVDSTLAAMPDKITDIREATRTLMAVEGYLSKLHDAFFMCKGSRAKIAPSDLFEAHIDQSVAAQDREMEASRAE